MLWQWWPKELKGLQQGPEEWLPHSPWFAASMWHPACNSPDQIPQSVSLSLPVLVSRTRPGTAGVLLAHQQQRCGRTLSGQGQLVLSQAISGHSWRDNTGLGLPLKSSTGVLTSFWGGKGIYACTVSHRLSATCLIYWYRSSPSVRARLGLVTGPVAEHLPMHTAEISEEVQSECWIRYSIGTGFVPYLCWDVSKWANTPSTLSWCPRGKKMGSGGVWLSNDSTHVSLLRG